jgi:hypothetical protein
MSLLAQTVLVFGLMLLILGYFQYRRNPDVVAIGQEMLRPSYLLPAAIIALAYLVIKFLLTAFNGII